MSGILSDPRFLNLLFSSAILISGLIIYWFFSPTLFKTVPFAERAFEVWLLKWLLYLMTWGLLAKGADPRWTLATVDVNNVLTIGFFLIFLWGADYSQKKLWLNLTFCFGLLFSWNFVSYSWAFGLGKAEWWATWGIKPSMVAATGAIALMAIVYVWRYRHAGLAFALVSIAYVILQLPAYNIIFPSPNASRTTSNSDWLLWLAFAKLLYAMSFYTSFFSRVPESAPVHLPTFEVQPRLRRAITFVSLAVGSGILTAVGELIGKYLLRHFAT